MNQNIDQQYEDELNEAIRISMVNFMNTQTKQEKEEFTVPTKQKEEVKFEFTAKDLANDAHMDDLSLRTGSENEKLFEESKDGFEGYSYEPPSVEPKLTELNNESIQEILLEY